MLSHVEADSSLPLQEETVGSALRAAADAAPHGLAMVEGGPDPAGRRRWTFAQLLEQSEQVAREAAVVGLPDEKWGGIVAAFIRDADRNDPAGEAELRTYLREHLAPHKTPAVWVHVDAFPLTPSGKIQKFALRDAWSSGTLTPAAP